MSQSQKDQAAARFHSKCPSVVQFTETESRAWLPEPGEGDGEEEFSNLMLTEFADERSSRDGWLHTSVTGLVATELYTSKWLRWYILCHGYFTTIKNNFFKFKKKH